MYDRKKTPGNALRHNGLKSGKSPTLCVLSLPVNINMTRKFLGSSVSGQVKPKLSYLASPWLAMIGGWKKINKYNSEDDPKNTIPGQAWRWKHSGGVFWKGYRANSLYWWAKEFMSCTVTYRARQEQLACGVAYSQPPDPNPIQNLWRELKLWVSVWQARGLKGYVFLSRVGQNSSWAVFYACVCQQPFQSQVTIQ